MSIPSARPPHLLLVGCLLLGGAFPRAYADEAAPGPGTPVTPRSAPPPAPPPAPEAPVAPAAPAQPDPVTPEAATPAPTAAALAAEVGASLEAIEAAFGATEKQEVKRVRTRRMLAIDAYVRARPDAADVEDARASLVRLAGNTESWERGVAYADAYLAAHPGGRAEVDALFTKADALSHLDRVPETRAAYERLTHAVDPSKDLDTAFAAWSFYATWLKAQGEVEGAKTVYRGMKAAFQSTKNGPAVGNTADGEISALEQIGKPARAFPPDARDLDGRPVTLEALRGKIVLIDFWATWCAPCVAEMPDVVAAERKYRALGFEVLGVTLDAPKDAGKVRSFVESHDMPWRQVHYPLGRNTFAEAYGVRAVPHTLLVGRDGLVLGVGVRGRDLDKALARAFGVPAKR